MIYLHVIYKQVFTIAATFSAALKEVETSANMRQAFKLIINEESNKVDSKVVGIFINFSHFCKFLLTILK